MQKIDPKPRTIAGKDRARDVIRCSSRSQTFRSGRRLEGGTVTSATRSYPCLVRWPQTRRFSLQDDEVQFRCLLTNPITLKLPPVASPPYITHPPVVGKAPLLDPRKPSIRVSPHGGLGSVEESHRGDPDRETEIASPLSKNEPVSCAGTTVTAGTSRRHRFGCSWCVSFVCPRRRRCCDRALVTGRRGTSFRAPSLDLWNSINFSVRD
ncbi:hypothetical protein GWI33_008957 [Rhynchophorus ferrugineus]|uniref:Uncharacterized protein n=1 Tax=Rhynchophorus ferrugineus TaxID=354439 RepID=A0A834MBX4_RHYFE|nr:hypothetical protein GWI33_008957 [Rhynchophorus ferrugineus]